MAISANGWLVLASRPALYQVPLIEPSVRFACASDDVAAVLLEVARRWHEEVEPLDLPGIRDEWGWAYRPIRGKEDGFSNHASATAIDLNATRHPFRVPTADTLTSAQISRCKAIKASMHDVGYGKPIVAWGGEYKTTPDAMHWEIATGVTPGMVKRVADRIRNKWREIEEDMAAPTAQEVADAVVKTLFATKVKNLPYVTALFKDVDGESTLGELLNQSAGQARGALLGTDEANRELDALREAVTALTTKVDALLDQEA